MLSNVGLNLGDSGLTFLYIFFVFWGLVIVVGLFLEMKELGYGPGNFINHTKELYRKYIRELEHRPKHYHKRRRIQ